MIHLYVKTHLASGIKYFGKTESDNVEAYSGSGKRWKNIIRKYPSEISTEIIASFDQTQLKQCKEFAIKFSLENNIVESESWANLKLEELDGGFNNINCDENIGIWRSKGGKTCQARHPNLARSNFQADYETMSARNTKSAQTCKEKYGVSDDGKSLAAVARGKKSSSMQTEEKKDRISKTLSGTKVVNNGSVAIKAKGDELETLLKEGWVYGTLTKYKKPTTARKSRIISEETKAKIAEAMRKSHASRKSKD